MSRPAVTVVMPFAGDEGAARGALDALRALDATDRDQLVLADNVGTAPRDEVVEVVPADGERSPAGARNAGALGARHDWILFLDADCRPRPDLLSAFFAKPIGDDVGALAGEVRGVRASRRLAARYGADRAFLGQAAHLAHPYLPRAAAANLLVRRTAFAGVGGFFEGLRAAEDTDFCWRLQMAGWRLELRSEAWVEHAYRESVRDLLAQWRAYAAGRAWLARRYPGFTPEPAVVRAARRLVRRRPPPAAAPRLAPPRTVPEALAPPEPPTPAGAPERAARLALDAALAAEELAGFALSNRPSAPAPRHPGGGASERAGARVVLVADRFPARADPLVELATALEGARVEALARPSVPARVALEVAYREDDGILARALATAWLLGRHPWRALNDLATPDGAARRRAPLSALAPAVRRLAREGRGARIQPLGGGAAVETARRLATLSGRSLSGPDGS